LFVRGMRAAELALVEGTLDQPLEFASYCEGRLPGELKPIADLLDLPIVAVVPVPQCLGGDFHLPPLPEGIDGVFIDRIARTDDLPRLRRLFRLACKVPVLGALETLPALRDELEQTPRNQILPEKSVMALGEHFLRNADLDAIRDLARSRPFPDSVHD